MRKFHNSQKDTRSFEEKMKGAEFGYNGVSIPAFTPSEATPTVQREEEVEENLQEQGEGETSAANISVFAPSISPPENRILSPFSLLQTDGLGEQETIQREEVFVGEEEKEGSEVGIQKQHLQAPPDDRTIQLKCDECGAEKSEEKEEEKYTEIIQTKAEISEEKDYTQNTFESIRGDEETYIWQPKNIGKVDAKLLARNELNGLSITQAKPSRIRAKKVSELVGNTETLAAGEVASPTSEVAATTETKELHKTIQAKFSNNGNLDKNLNKEEQKVSQMSFQEKLLAAIKLSANLLEEDAKNTLQQLLNDPQFVAELIAVGAIFAALQAVPVLGQAIDAALLIGLGFQAGYNLGQFLVKVWQAKDEQGLNAAAVSFKNLVEAVGLLALTGVLKLAGRILRAIKGGGQTAAVWNAIKATDVVYEGTLIPRSFELTVGNKKFWVAPNATEHLFDELRGYIRSRGSTQDAERFTQFLLDDFKNSVTEATKQGITYNQEIRVGIWEFVFGPPRQPGQLPVIFHAEPQGNIQIPR